MNFCVIIDSNLLMEGIKTMSKTEIREPIQKRSIEKKEKIIKAGFELICLQGYHNTTTPQIAKKAGVSTGIVYQYFNDKHDIFIAGLEKYADSIFYPINDIYEEKFDKNDLSSFIKNIIKKYIENHKLSDAAHEEIMAMTHSDKDVAYYYYKREIDMTKNIDQILENNGYSSENLMEKVHLIIGLIDNLCHEIIYHKHSEINYDIMTNFVVESIVKLLN